MSKATEVETGYFNIVLDPLTPQEFAALRTHTKSQADWKNATWLYLHRLYNITPNQTSRAVMDALMRSGKRCVITPISAVKGAVFQGETRALDPDGGIEAGEPMLNERGQTLCLSGFTSLGCHYGSGAGSDIVIEFDAANWTGRVEPGMEAGELLLHELVHALRGELGRGHTSLFNRGSNQNYTTIEEFDAIVISNIFRSENGETEMRADHEGYTKLSTPLDNDVVFAKTYAEELDNLISELFLLSIRIGAIDCPYNPIRRRLLTRFGAGQLSEWASVQGVMYGGYPEPEPIWSIGA